MDKIRVENRATLKKLTKDYLVDKILDLEATLDHFREQLEHGERLSATHQLIHGRTDTIITHVGAMGDYFRGQTERQRRTIGELMRLDGRHFAICPGCGALSAVGDVQGVKMNKGEYSLLLCPDCVTGKETS
jgi:hypothetical protein